MERVKTDTKVMRLVLAALMACLILVGKRDGALAAGIGSALGDLLGGYAFWMPWTFVIKFLMAFLMGIFIEKVGADRHVTNEGYRITWVDLMGMLVGGMEMVAGYLVAERFIYGNWATAVIGVPWNIGQFVVGGALAVIIAGALCKTPVRKYFLGKGRQNA